MQISILKRFQISSLDELPDYDELINKIQVIRGDTIEQDYLYHKEDYVEEEVAVTEAISKPKRKNKKVNLLFSNTTI